MPEIWKYTLIDGVTTPFRISEDHTFLHVGVQNNEICVWAQVDPTQSWVSRTFRIIGSRQHKPDKFFDEWTYLGTVIVADGTLVWHVYVEDAIK